MSSDPAPSLATWLDLPGPVEPDALPKTLRQDLARAALADGQPALTLALAEAERSESGPVWAWDAAAAAHLALGHADEALRLTDARLARASAIAPVRLRADALVALGRAEEALAGVRALVERQPDAVSAWGALGDVALALGALDDAADAYARVRELSSTSVSAAVGQARVRLAAGDAQGARALLESLVEEGGGTLLATYADACAACGDTARADALRARIADGRAAARAVWRERLAPHQSPDAPDVGAPLDAIARPSARASTPDSALPRPSAPMGAAAAPGGAPAEPPEPAAFDAPEPPPSPALRQALGEYFGFDAFRPGQVAVCQAMLDGQDTLAVMPTGAGKSLCFQLPAMLLDGVTVVVSPLVALMKDQLDGLPPPVYERATLLNSTLDAVELARRLDRLAGGQYRLLYVAPERLGQPALLAALRRAGVTRMVVDEAHCVSAWGHDFRPDYLAIGQALRRLGDPPLLAVTATASPAVRSDIGAGLGRQFAVRQTPLFRPNLRYEVRHAPNAEAKLAALVELCRAERGSVVVYVNSRQRTEELAQVLRRHGVQAAHYHAGLDPETRGSVQDAFMLDRSRVIVATVAFGMGVDKANIRLVVHFSLPESLEAYVQESGRAGRDGRPARCVLLTAPADRTTLTRWLKAERLTLEDLRAVYRQVQRQLGDERVSLVDERALGHALGDEGADTRGRVALGLLERAGLLRRLGMVPAEVSVEPPPRAPLGGRGPAGDEEVSFDALFDDEPGATPTVPEARVAPRAAAPPPDALAERLLAAGPRGYEGLALAARLDLPPDELEPWLMEARELGWLRYRATGRGLAVERLPAPPDATYRLESLLAEYAAHQDRRIADIVGYADGGTCRHARICRHFGQRLDPPCEACDVCAPDATARPAVRATNAPESGPTMPLATAILGCLADVSFPLGRRGLVRVLQGSVQAPIGPDRTRFHGALRGVGATAIEKTVDRLVAEDYLARAEYRDLPVLALTARGRAGPPPWDVAPARVRDARAGWSPADESQAGAPDLSPEDEAAAADRFERLRAWRRQEASAAGIAPFMVFSDTTLRALAALPPGAADRDTLATVPGIGPAKLARYGAALVDLLSAASGEPMDAP